MTNAVNRKIASSAKANSQARVKQSLATDDTANANSVAAGVVEADGAVIEGMSVNELVPDFNDRKEELKSDLGATVQYTSLGTQWELR